MVSTSSRRVADVELDADGLGHVVERGARVGDERSVVLAHHRGQFVLVVLVGDVADDLLDDVLHRNQAVGAAVFVDHQREMDARRLHLLQQVERRHRRRHEQHLAHDLGRRQRHREIDGVEVEPAARGFLRRVGFSGSTAACAVMNAIRSRMCTMPTGSSSVSL